MAEKVWIASKYTNRVVHRKLKSFEERNPKMFEIGSSAHATREEAMDAMVGYRKQTLEKAKKELARAERAFAKALCMQKECHA